MIARLIALFAFSALIVSGCADPTELEQERKQEAEELSSYVSEIQGLNGATLIISDAGKTTFSITKAGHPLRGVRYELNKAALPAFDKDLGEILVLELTPGELPGAASGEKPALVGSLVELTDQTVVGPVVNIDIRKFPGNEDVSLVAGGVLTLPIEPCVPALVQKYLGAADLTDGSESLVTDTTVKFRNRQVIAQDVIEGTYAPVLGGSKRCEGLASSQPPIAGGLQFSVKEDDVLNAQLSVVDDNPDDIEYNLVSGTTDGALTLNEDGSFTYTPDPDFYGQDRFVFDAFDGFEQSNTGTATIFVSNVNDAPVAYDVDVTMATSDSNAAGEVTASDIDHSILGLAYRVTADPALGSVLMQPCTGKNGCSQGRAKFTYTLEVTAGAACGAGGSDVFEFVASDLVDDSNAADVTITFTDCP